MLLDPACICLLVADRLSEYDLDSLDDCNPDVFNEMLYDRFLWISSTVVKVVFALWVSNNVAVDWHVSEHVPFYVF